MKVIAALSAVITQAEFAQMIGVSEAAVSQLKTGGTLEPGVTAQRWLLAYCERLREQAAGRLGSDIDGLDLVQERAALAREQRLGYEIKNAIARGEYAPIGVLADVLASASQAIVERFEMLPGQLKKVCPDLPEEARQRIEAVHADARNEWLRATAELVSARLAESAAATDDGLLELPSDADA